MNQEDQKKYLWAKFRKGDIKAFEQIYAYFYNDLYHYSLKLTSHSQLAEDAVQETYLDLWNYKNSIQDIRSLKFYLLKSVRNQCLKLLKKQNRYLDFSSIDTLSIIIEPEELHLNDNSSIIKRKIKEALNHLSPRQKEIIYLKFYNNLDYREIAEVLDINYQSVVNHIHKAILKLRQLAILQYFQ